MWSSGNISYYQRWKQLFSE